MFDVRSEDVVGKLPHEIHYSELADELRQQDLFVLETGEVFVGEFEAYTTQDNKNLRTMLATKFPILNNNHEVKGLGAIITDITEQKIAQERLELSEAMLRRATKIAKVGHFIWDNVNEKCHEMSEEGARMVGVSVEDYFHLYSSDEDNLNMVHVDDREKYELIVGEAEKTKSQL